MALAAQAHWAQPGQVALRPLVAQAVAAAVAAAVALAQAVEQQSTAAAVAQAAVLAPAPLVGHRYLAEAAAAAVTPHPALAEQAKIYCAVQVAQGLTRWRLALLAVLRAAAVPVTPRLQAALVGRAFAA